jgi:hypothetical protein
VIHFDLVFGAGYYRAAVAASGQLPTAERGEAMMGSKARLFTPLPSMTLEELIPADIGGL